jgi:glutamate racemase
LKKLSHFANAIIILLLIFFPSCGNHIKVSNQKFKIISEVANNSNSPFYFSSANYPKQRKKLPIGVFDSGTGGLTVLNTIYEMDNFNNADKSLGQDGILDFNSEKFIYLADESNMPYGRYDSEGKADFLRELIIKDVRFLLGDSYYNSPDDAKPLTDKQAVKAIVIACNTATAYGLEIVEQAVKDWGLDIRIMGIVDAGSKAVLPDLTDPLKKIIGVLASEGTCSSQGYPKSIKKNYEEIYGGQEIAVVQQAGIGLAGAIDGDLNYIDLNATKLRDSDSYKGPDIGHPNYPLDPSLWEAYNFEEGNSLLTEYDEEGKLIHAQLNSVNNYIRYMATHMLINAQNDFPDKSLSKVILGCTHYPYFVSQIKEHFLYLKNLNPIYDKLIDADIQFVDPSESLAVELYQYLNENNLWGTNRNEDSQFYISVPNPLLTENTINEKGEFPYDYKYGRTLNSNLQYVKVVPFSDEWIKESIRERMKSNIPYTHKMIYQN